MQLTILRRTKSTASSSWATAGKISRGSEEKDILGSKKKVQRINGVFGGIGRHSQILRFELQASRAAALLIRSIS